MAQPYPRALSPMGLGDVLDETFRVYRRHFLPFVVLMGVALVPGLALIGLSVVLILAGLFALGVLCFFLGIFALVGGFLLSEGAATIAGSRGFLTEAGRVVSVKESYLLAAHQFGRLVGATVLAGLVLTGVAFASLPLLVFFVFGLFGLVPLAGVLVWGLIPSSRHSWLKWAIILTTPFGLFVYFAMQLSFYAQALFLEDLAGRACLGRSRELVAGHWWRVFGVVVLVGILVSIVQAVPGYLLAVPVGILEAMQADEVGESGLPIASAVSQLGSVLGFVLFGAVQWIAMTVQYYDLRIRKEGFDLELRARALAGPLGSSGP